MQILRLRAAPFAQDDILLVSSDGACDLSREDSRDEVFGLRLWFFGEGLGFGLGW
jgi:hypothetical protein